MLRSLVLVAVAFAATALQPTAAAQAASRFATKVIAFDTKNRAGGGIFQPNNALGSPDGRNAFGVHSLGTGGFLSLGFDVVITDGHGADFIVFENSFTVGGKVFAEVMHVEVSTDGQSWARFPSAYQGAPVSGPFATNFPGVYSGLAGVRPTWTNPSRRDIDPLDVASAGGDAFDLFDLRNHPQVRNGRVKLSRIHFVRLVDVVAGQTKDARGIPIQDPTTGSADVDGIAVIHDVATSSVQGPRVELTVMKSGDVELRISDPDGLTDIDLKSLRAAIDATVLPPDLLIGLMRVTALSSTSVTLRLGVALPAQFRFQLSFSLKDRAGHRSGMTRTRPDR